MLEVLGLLTVLGRNLFANLDGEEVVVVVLVVRGQNLHPKCRRGTVWHPFAPILGAYAIGAMRDHLGSILILDSLAESWI